MLQYINYTLLKFANRVGSLLRAVLGDAYWNHGRLGIIIESISLSELLFSVATHRRLHVCHLSDYPSCGKFPIKQTF